MKSFAGHHLVSVGVGVGVGVLALVLALLLPVEVSFVSPMSFGLMGPAHWAFGTARLKRRVAFERRAAGQAAASV